MVPAEDIKEGVINDIEEIRDEDITVRHTIGPKGKHFNHWVIEVSAKARETMLERERIYLGWTSCVVRGHVRLIRCFKCQKYGHLQNICKSEVACGHCGGRHDTKDCMHKTETPKCVNCTNASIRENVHEARSMKCPILNKRTEEYIVNTDYGL